jgi:hypothetical protein
MKVEWCRNYHGTFFKMSNLTASASNAATMSAHASSESVPSENEVPLLEEVVVDLSVDTKNAPFAPRGYCAGG